MIKVSLRSVGSFPCNRLATEFFNGGGHLNASGGEFYGTLEEAKKCWNLHWKNSNRCLMPKDKKTAVVKVKRYELSTCNF